MVSVAPTARQAHLDLLRHEPNAFIEAVIGFRQADLHLEMQSHLDSADHVAYSTHRGGGKTDQISICRATWEIGRDPEIRIKCVKNADGEASKVTDAARRIINSPKYREVFPWVRMDPAHWSGNSFRVLRKNRHEKEPTYQAYGILSTATGGRADLLIYDDICDMKNTIQNPALREKVRQAYQNTFQPMLVKGGRSWRVYTPYHVNDVSIDWERNPMIRSISRPVVGWRSLWADEFPPERLKTIAEDIGNIAFARAFLLKRISDEDILVRAEWLDQALYKDTYHRRSGILICSIDFAFTKERKGGVTLAGSDPDYSVCIKAWIDQYAHAWIEMVDRVRMTYPEFKELLISRGTGCDYLIAEEVQAQRGLIQDLNHTTALVVRSRYPTERETGEQAGGYDKKGRLARESVAIEAGKLHLKGISHGNDLLVARDQEPLYDELTTFPVADHDDCVDACTQLLKEARKRFGKGRKQQKKKEDEEGRTSLRRPPERVRRLFPGGH